LSRGFVVPIEILLETSMTIDFLDPAAEQSAPVEQYGLRLDLAKRPLALGLIANSFPDSRNFMDHVERALADLLPGVTLRRYQKPTVEPVSPKVLAEIERDCDGVVAAWGH
jgi:hypothetical protein